MMPTHPIAFRPDQQAAFVRAFRSLTFGDAKVVSQLVDVFGDAWSVQTGDDYNGYLFMLIEPFAERAKQLPSFMVSGTIERIELAVVNGDDYQTLGYFGDIYGLTVELAAHLTSS